MDEAGLLALNETLNGKENLIICFHWVVILHSSILSEKKIRTVLEVN